MALKVHRLFIYLIVKNVNVFYFCFGVVLKMLTNDRKVHLRILILKMTPHVLKFE